MASCYCIANDCDGFYIVEFDDPSLRIDLVDVFVAKITSEYYDCS